MTNGRSKYLVAVIISTFKSERFIKQKLDDLLAQTIADRLEIIIIDSNSPENEKSIVNSYQLNHDNIKYIRTSETETLYKAWNRGIAESSAPLITNSNTDDRLRTDALEVLSNELQSSPDIDIVYGDCYLSTKENETFEQNSKDRRYYYPDYFAPSSLLHFQFSPFPMWRRSAHDKIGLFDENLKAVGDYDFNIRAALNLKAKHIRTPVGLYLDHEESITSRDSTMSNEKTELLKRTHNIQTIISLYQMEGIPCSSPQQIAECLNDLAIRATSFFLPWAHQKSSNNFTLAIYCLESCIEIAPEYKEAYLNLAIIYSHTDNHKKAKHYLKLFLNKYTPDSKHTQIINNVKHNARPTLNRLMKREAIPVLDGLITPSLSFPNQKELAFGE